MKPAARTRVWRKARRAALKGAARGRRTTHLVRIQTPSRGSTWLRRHNDWDYWAAHAGTDRLIADLTRTAAPADTAAADETPQGDRES